MKISKALTSCLILSCISVIITGCNKSSPNFRKSPVPSDTSAVAENVKAPTPVQSLKAPEVYDVICFQAMGLMVARTMCSPDDTYKIPRNTEVTVHPKQESSVQNGTETKISFDYKGQIQKITIPEMESLASQGANVYAMYYHIVPVMLSNSQQFVEVELFNNNLGAFKMFDQDKTKVIFKTGDTKVRVELPQRKEGLMGDMQAVQNGGIYRKIFTTNKPAE